jgi:hypothetical protein
MTHQPQPPAPLADADVAAIRERLEQQKRIHGDYIRAHDERASRLIASELMDWTLYYAEQDMAALLAEVKRLRGLE